MAITLCAPMKRATNSERGALNTSRGEPVCSMRVVSPMPERQRHRSSCECVNVHEA